MGCEEDPRFSATMAQDHLQCGRIAGVDFRRRTCGRAEGKMCNKVIDELTRRSTCEQVLHSGDFDTRIEWLIGE